MYPYTCLISQRCIVFCERLSRVQPQGRKSFFLICSLPEPSLFAAPVACLIKYTWGTTFFCMQCSCSVWAWTTIRSRISFGRVVFHPSCCVPDTCIIYSTERCIGQTPYQRRLMLFTFNLLIIKPSPVEKQWTSSASVSHYCAALFSLWLWWSGFICPKWLKVIFVKALAELVQCDWRRKAIKQIFCSVEATDLVVFCYFRATFNLLAIYWCEEAMLHVHQL